MDVQLPVPGVLDVDVLWVPHPLQLQMPRHLDLTLGGGVFQTERLHPRILGSLKDRQFPLTVEGQLQIGLLQPSLGGEIMIGMGIPAVDGKDFRVIQPLVRIFHGFHNGSPLSALVLLFPAPAAQKVLSPEKGKSCRVAAALRMG